MAVVLMTGATGLIGSRVRRLWRSGAGSLRVVGREDVDILEPGALAAHVERQRPNVLLHLAWRAGSTSDYRDAPENQVWAEVSLEAATRCRELGARFVGTGTVLDDTGGTDAYARAKQRVRRELSDWIAEGSVTWLRPFYVFDPDGHRPGVLGAARAAIAHGRTPSIDDPRAAHDFVHVDDVARGVIAAVEARAGGVVEIGSGVLHTVADLLRGTGLPWEPSGRRVELSHDARVADTTVLAALGWTPSDTERFFGDDR